jgi:protein pelota
MRLGIRVEKVGFHEFSDRLRVHGIIEEGPQDLGSYHTLNISTMEEFSIIKQEWKDHHLSRIEEAVRQRTQPIIIFVSLDEEKATLAILRQSGVQFIAEVESKRSGKMYESKESAQEYYSQILSILKIYKSPLIIVGPGFAKEELLKYVKGKYPELFKECRVHATGHAGMNGIQEAIKEGIVERIVKDNRVSKETLFIEKLFEEIKKDGPVAYGEREVREALNRGAVKKLLISDFFLRNKKGEELLQLAKKINSKFLIVNSAHEAGKRFKGIGGVAAFLRFRYAL